MSFDKYCKITLVNKIIIETPEDNEPNTLNLLGQEYEAKSHLKDNIKFLKELPFFNGLRNLDEIYTEIKSKTNIYNEDQIKTITINPYDKSHTGNNQWRDQTTNQKENSINKTFKQINKLYDNIYLFPEMSDEGRFHYHGIIFCNDKRNYHFILEALNKRYSNKPSSTKNTYAVKLDRYNDSFFQNIDSNKQLKNKTTGFNYLTKDYGYMKALGYKPIIKTGLSRKGLKHKTIKKPIEISFEELDKIIN